MWETVGRGRGRFVTDEHLRARLLVGYKHGQHAHRGRANRIHAIIVDHLIAGCHGWGATLGRVPIGRCSGGRVKISFHQLSAVQVTFNI